MTDRLADAQGDGDQIGQQGSPEPEGNGYGHLLDDQVDDAGIAKEAIAEVEGQVTLDHQPEALVGWFIEAVHPFDFGDDFRVQTLGAAVVAAAGDFALGAAANPAGCPFEAFQVGDHLLHRAARRSLDDQEVDQQDAEQGRNDQQQAPDDVGEHGSGLLLGGR